MNRCSCPVGRRVIGPPDAACLSGLKICVCSGLMISVSCPAMSRFQNEYLSCSVLISPSTVSSRRCKRGQRGRPLWHAHLFHVVYFFDYHRIVMLKYNKISLFFLV